MAKNIGKKVALRSRETAKERWWEKIPLATKVAAGVGAGALLVFGAPVLVPVGVGVVGVAGWQAYRRSRCMTPERKKVLEQALSTLKDPKKLRVLADEFERGGCAKEAEHLRRRASLYERSPEEHKADRLKYRSALKEKDVAKIEKVAQYFDSIAADGSAANLRTRIKALKAVA